ncbi:MAG TPA: hypothetical protein VKY27_03815, partial [Bacteriovoracaceae bacterium]|nr:hypothetical protein [Bacteriovoracaceae bacterium]
KKIAPYFFSLFLFLCSLAGLTFLYEKKVTKEKALTNKSLLIPVEERPLNGAKPYLDYIRPNSVYRIYKHFNNEVIYDVKYEFNEFSLRDIPQHNPQKDDHHLVFAGCSFTFGEGLYVEETFPYLVEQQIEGYHTYNWSFMGGGIHRLLNHADFLPLKEHIKQEKGKLFYMFFADHLNRFHATPDYISWAAYKDPIYKVEEGKIVYKGIAGETSSYRQYQYFKKLGLGNFFVKFYSIFKMYYRGDKELEDFVIAVKTLKEKYLQNFSEGEFTFVFHPLFLPRDNQVERMKPLLTKHGISYIDPTPEFRAYSATLNTDKASTIFRISNDGHPSHFFNQFLSNYFLENVLKRSREI